MLPAILLIASVSYLLGSIPIGYLLVRIFRRQDIRSVGSGNIGATNVLRSRRQIPRRRHLPPRRTQRLRLRLARRPHRRPPSPRLPIPRRASPGRPLRRPRPHLPRLAPFPRRQRRSHRLWRLPGRRSLRRTGRHRRLRLRACSSAVIVSLASILGAASFPVFAWFLVHGPRPSFFIAVQFAVALLIIVKHHQNIRRLLDGTESRFGAKRNRMSRIVVLGSGAWGTAIALSLHRRGGHQLTLWAHSPEVRPGDPRRPRKHLFLPGFPLPAEITVTGDCAAVSDAEIVVSVIPSEFLRSTLCPPPPASPPRPNRRQRHQRRRRPHLPPHDRSHRRQPSMNPASPPIGASQRPQLRL